MNKRNMSIDLLKIILAIFVVLLHCNIFRENYPALTFLSVHGVFRISVPIFFIINGYFLNKVFMENKIFNWAKRVFILYLIWMLIYIKLWFSFDSQILIYNILDGYHHLWYLRAMLFGGVILFYLKNLSSCKLIAISFILFLIGVIFQYLFNFNVINLEENNSYFSNTIIHRNFLFFGFPFITIGYLINREDWGRISIKFRLKQAFFISIVLIIIESSLNFLFTQQGIDNLFFLILICPTIFIIALNSKINLEIDSKMIAKISTAIYLTHPLIIYILGAIYNFSSISLALLTVPLSIISSVVLIKLDSRLKFLL